MNATVLPIHEKEEKEEKEEEKEEKEGCIICLDDISIASISSNTNLLKLECGHRYHKDCINTWLKKRSICPLCIKTVIPVPDNQVSVFPRSDRSDNEMGMSVNEMRSNNEEIPFFSCSGFSKCICICVCLTLMCVFPIFINFK